MYQDRRETGTTLCFIRILPFVTVKNCVGHLNYLATHLNQPPSAQPPPQQQPPAIRRLPALPAPPNPSNNQATWPTGGGDAGEDGPREGGAAKSFADLADNELLTAAVKAAKE